MEGSFCCMRLRALVRPTMPLPTISTGTLDGNVDDEAGSAGLTPPSAERECCIGCGMSNVRRGINAPGIAAATLSVTMRHAG